MAYTLRKSRSVIRPLSCEEFEPRLCLTVPFAAHDIFVGELSPPSSVLVADLDGDQDLDVLSTFRWDGKIVWYEKADGAGSFGREKLIANAADGTPIYAADLDGDGDLDVLSADNTVAWYENSDGNGTFGTRHVIATSASTFWSVYAADMDNDGDVDVLTSAADLTWYENTNGNGEFGAPNIITTQANANSIYVADVDGDGDMDVFSKGGKQIAWYENTDGIGTFGEQQIIVRDGFGGFYSVYPVDMDEDGDVDLLTAGTRPMTWYENTDGAGRFDGVHFVSEDWAASVYPVDLDSDGDLDIVAGSSFGLFDFPDDIEQIAWYENEGTGSFREQQVISEDEAQWVYAADLDGDRDIDVLSASYISSQGLAPPVGKIAWFEHLSQVAPGDANRDFQFDQRDIVQVLQAAKYLTGQSATFEEGDWNGDGVFDPLDIVAALQTGRYLQGANPAHRPESNVPTTTKHGLDEQDSGSSDSNLEERLADLVLAVAAF